MNSGEVDSVMQLTTPVAPMERQDLPIFFLPSLSLLHNICLLYKDLSANTGPGSVNSKDMDERAHDFMNEHMTS